ncbi:hypothetical protein BT67DRAFT_86383 [Trichocladium antarcticum]|uniref:Uncharacterized protein n=1 Tax=Trichocladium antarcticum TaxID=1450529 RepID=A0AAN6UG10_9PEZI|nr:hypothetical protein BT67DRAFT_86383 [Trichocladium antarcticum]
MELRIALMPCQKNSELHAAQFVDQHSPSHQLSSCPLRRTRTRTQSSQSPTFHTVGREHERRWASCRLTTQNRDDGTINVWHSDDRHPQKRVGKHSSGGQDSGHGSSGRLEPARCTKAVIGHNSLSS